MACVLTSGHTLGCRDAVGGIKAVYLTELANKDTITATAGNISAFVLADGKQFWLYELEKETAECVEKIQTSVENGTVFYETELKIMLHKRSVALRNELMLVAQNRLMIMVLDRNGNYWLMGENNGADLSPSESPFGKAMGDASGYSLTFLAKETAPMQTVAANLIATLTAPAA